MCEAQGWQELGVKSAVNRARLQGLVKKASLEVQALHQSPLPGVSRQNPYDKKGLKLTKEVSDYFIATWTPFNPFKLSSWRDSTLTNSLVG